MTIREGPLRSARMPHVVLLVLVAQTNCSSTLTACSPSALPSSLARPRKSPVAHWTPSWQRSSKRHSRRLSKPREHVRFQAVWLSFRLTCPLSKSVPGLYSLVQHQLLVQPTQSCRRRGKMWIRFTSSFLHLFMHEHLRGVSGEHCELTISTHPWSKRPSRTLPDSRWCCE